MAKKRTSRRSTQGAASRAPRPRAPRRSVLPPRPRSLQYKVVELSAVDEASLERTLNEWTARGWQLENVQFAMRESSKRPSMAFVFFTREAAGEEAGEPRHEEPPEEAPLLPPRPVSEAWARLRQLAGGDDEGGGA